MDVAFLANPVALERMTDDGSDGRRILFIGELSARKGFDVFMEACALGAHAGWTGLAWGDDTEGLAAQAPANCRVAPARPLEVLIPDLRSADVWAIPSRRDPAPLTFSEALALGLRVTVSDAIAYSELATSTLGADVHGAEDPESLIASAERLISGSRPTDRSAAEVSEVYWADGIMRLLNKGVSA
jgi:glycosyltransferase involved in cell wall biosynthesis